MFCFCSLWLPPPSGAFHRTVGPFRSTHQSDSALPSATFRKIEFPQTMGVAPLHSGSGSFHATFESEVHLRGRPVSVLTPFNCGPRHCGQLSAERVATISAANDIESQRCFSFIEELDRNACFTTFESTFTCPTASAQDHTRVLSFSCLIGRGMQRDSECRQYSISVSEGAVYSARSASS